MSGASPHDAALANLPLPPSAAAALARYLDLLESWNVRVNLTGPADASLRVARLVAEVLPAAEMLDPGRLVDVGSGNGSPGLVLALLRPDLPATLLEPRRRRWAFLKEAARAVGRPDVEVLRCRHDGYPGPPAPTLTLRALALPLDQLAPLLMPGGRLFVFGGQPAAADPLGLERTHALPQSTLHVFRRR